MRTFGRLFEFALVTTLVLGVAYATIYPIVTAAADSMIRSAELLNSY